MVPVDDRVIGCFRKTAHPMCRGGVSRLGGNERGTEFIKEEIEKNLVIENDDTRSMYLSCREGFTANQEY